MSFLGGTNRSRKPEISSNAKRRQLSCLHFGLTDGIQQRCFREFKLAFAR